MGQVSNVRVSFISSSTVKDMAVGSQGDWEMQSSPKTGEWILMDS